MTTSDSPFDTREMSEKRPEKIFEEITENSLIWEREYLLKSKKCREFQTELIYGAACQDT